MSNPIITNHLDKQKIFYYEEILSRILPNFYSLRYFTAGWTVDRDGYYLSLISPKTYVIEYNHFEDFFLGETVAQVCQWMAINVGV